MSRISPLPFHEGEVVAWIEQEGTGAPARGKRPADVEADAYRSRILHG